MVIINSFRYPESHIKLQQRGVRLILDKEDLGTGTLFVSESTLCWQQRETSGITIGYHKISLHAISKDVNLHPTECIYIVIDGHISMPGAEQIEVLDIDSDADLPDVSEIIIAPEDGSCVQAIYEAIKVCQELNPDPNDMDDEDDNLYEDAEDDMEEGEYNTVERGGGDADVEELSRRMQGSGVNIQYNYSNGNNEDDEFQDAD